MKHRILSKKIVAVILCLTLVVANSIYLKAREENAGEGGIQTADQEVAATEDMTAAGELEESDVVTGVDTSGFKADFFKYNMNEINAATEAVYNAAEGAYPGYLVFTSTGTHKKQWNANHYQGVYQGLVKEKLDDNGMIQFNYAAAGLFERSNVAGVEKSYTDVHFPISYDEATGYYGYDSDANSIMIADEKNAVTGGKNGGFWPFGKNKITFGMHFSTEFYTTTNGTVTGKEDGTPMIFDFSGDDDVWVFIDGKLVIDLGGVHPMEGANINFQTGEVAYYTTAPEAKGTVYKSVLGENYNVYSNGILNQGSILNAGKHTLQMFYLERGGSKSNCKIRFNLPQVPIENVLQVTNKVKTVVNGKEVDDDTAFHYTVTRDGVPQANVTYSYINSRKEEQSKTTDAAGGFDLKDGETALFIQPENGAYVISEGLIPYYSSDYDAIVKVNGELREQYHNSADGSGNVLNAELNLKTNEAPANYRVDFHNVRTVNYEMQTTKTATLKDWKARTYTIRLGVYHTTDDAAYPDAPKANVIDYVDSRFELVDGDGKTLKHGDLLEEGVVGYDKETDRYFVLWTDQAIKCGSSEAPSWSRSFTIHARANYLGGNIVETNGPESGVKMGEKEVLFPMPHVNVRSMWQTKDAQDMIFLGESLSGYCNKEKLDYVSGTLDGKDARDVSVDITWKDDADSKLDGDVLAKIQGMSPKEDCSFHATATVTPNYMDVDYRTKEVAEQMKNADGVLYTASMQTAQDQGADKLVRKGTYDIRVRSGELTICKDFDLEYLNNIGYTQSEKDAVDAKQSAVFIIRKYAPEDVECKGKVLDTYKTVISYDAEAGSSHGSVKLIDLPIGNYKVTEATDWSWKYLLESVTDTYEGNDGILFIGRRDQAKYQSADGYFGQKDTKEGVNGFAQVTFTNKLDQAKEWFSDTTHTNNIFK